MGKFDNIITRTMGYGDVLKELAERIDEDAKLERDDHFTAIMELITERDAIQKALPSTYFADRDLSFRVERIVEDWRRLIMVNKQLQEEHDAWQDERDNLRQALELARPQHKVVEDCWYSCPLSDECCNTGVDRTKCNCGADYVNAQIDEALGTREAQGG